MSVLARLAGVPAATIKHYIREGLLPQAAKRTSKNMAFYDVASVERIVQIKTLQREQFLPLDLIKSVLDGAPPPKDDEVAAKAIERALATMAQTETRSRAELLAAGLPAKELALFEQLGVVDAITVDGREVFTGDDLALLRVLGAARREGITPEMLPAAALGPYVAALQALARVELEMFRSQVVPRAGSRLPQVADAATRLSEQLVVLLRRKLLLPALAAIVAESKLSSGRRASAQGSASRGRRRPPRSRSRRAGRSSGP